MIAEPPSSSGALHVRRMLKFKAVGDNEVGAPGMPVVAVAVLDGSLAPALLIALTLNR